MTRGISFVGVTRLGSSSRSTSACSGAWPGTGATLGATKCAWRNSTSSLVNNLRRSKLSGLELPTRRFRPGPAQAGCRWGNAVLRTRPLTRLVARPPSSRDLGQSLGLHGYWHGQVGGVADFRGEAERRRRGRWLGLSLGCLGNRNGHPGTECLACSVALLLAARAEEVVQAANADDAPVMSGTANVWRSTRCSPSCSCRPGGPRAGSAPTGLSLATFSAATTAGWQARRPMP